jgi:hypothetical protein
MRNNMPKKAKQFVDQSMRDKARLAKLQPHVAAKSEPPLPPRIKIVCSHCGSDDVRRDADAVWNVDTQEWELNALYDKGAVCEQCGGETSLKEVQIGTLSRWEVCEHCESDGYCVELMHEPTDEICATCPSFEGGE